jgi:hypothetical protein
MLEDKRESSASGIKRQGASMNILPLLLAIPLATAHMSAGPETFATATPVDAAIDEATVYSDRARVRRVAKVTLAQGANAIRIPDLPGGTFMDTIRVEAQGAEVARVEVSKIQLERVSLEQVDDLLTRLEALNDRLAFLASQYALIDESIAFTARLQPKAAVAESERVGRPRPPIDPTSWTRALDFLSTERLALYRRRAALKTKEQVARRAHEALRREIARYDLGGLSDKKIRVVALLDVPSRRPVTVRVEYFVPGAHWKPNYDLHFDSTKNRVTVRAAGSIQQATGESWDNVRLRLSTAMPGHSLAIPELLTWTLGEEREYVPRAFEHGQRPQQQVFPEPQQRKVGAEIEAAARRKVLTDRVAQLRHLTSRTPGTIDGRAKNQLARLNALNGVLGVQGTLARGDVGSVAGGLAASRAKRSRGGRAKQPASALRRSTHHKFEDEAVLVAEPSAPGQPRVQHSLALFAGRSVRRPTLADKSLPAMLAGGMDYVFVVPQRTTIPADGRSLRAPFDSQTYAVVTSYEATPSIEKTAFLKAQVLYTGRKPMLAGPANVFINGRFTSNTMLKTTGPNGRLSLPLGADEDIRLVRNIVASSKTEGVFSKDDVTRYTVTMEVGNYKRRAVRIQLIDQIPKTNIEDIQIERIRLPKNTTGPDGAGVLRWTRLIPPGKTESIVFSYEIRRPADWRLHQ